MNKIADENMKMATKIDNRLKQQSKGEKRKKVETSADILKNSDAFKEMIKLKKQMILNEIEQVEQPKVVVEKPSNLSPA
jgi:hypothetical protein